MRYLLCLCMLLISTTATATESNFSSVKLPKGVEVQVPKGWRWQLQGKDYQRMVETSVEAVMDLSGIDMGDGNSVNLITVRSMPLTTYATLRIDSTTPPSATPQEYQNVTKAELREISLGMKQVFEKALLYQGRQLLDFYGAHTEQISGLPALVTRYRRSGNKGPIVVEVILLSTGNQDLDIILSYRESEKAIWLAVIEKIKRSINIK